MKLIFPKFSIYILIFALIGQKRLKKWVKFFSSQIFMEIVRSPNFDLKNSKIKFIFGNFFILIFILGINFFPIFIRQIVEKLNTEIVKDFFYFIFSKISMKMSI